MSISQDTLTGVQWHEPVEGLEFGETFLGGIASTYLGRGRSIGYAVYFTDRRVIGVRMRLLTQALLAPYIVVICILYILTLLEIRSTVPLFGFLPLIVIGVDYGLRIPTRRLSERIVSRRGNDIVRSLRGKKNFEFSRTEIDEFLMKSPPPGLSLGSKGYLKITPKSSQVHPLEIKIYGWKQGQKLRDLVISFSSREPKVKALEYP
ncbi:hypothetical protein J2P12_04910 [Candidatus Bathyarchaeota archaeon]|nr:hypothetical protein [Candidatus Bathyarchaeota archaeon]